MALQFSIKEASDETTILFTGQIDAEVGNALRQVHAQLKTKRLIFDCGGITRINSIGITVWLKALIDFNDRVYSFCNCTDQFVDAAVMIPQFPGKGWITSFRIHLYCINCENKVLRHYETSGGQVPDFTAPGQCPKCNGQLEIDSDLAGNLDILDGRGSFKSRV